MLKNKTQINNTCILSQTGAEIPLKAAFRGELCLLLGVNVNVNKHELRNIHGSLAQFTDT